MENLFSVLFQAIKATGFQSIQTSLSSYISTLSTEAVISDGSSLLKCFIQLNWTGPPSTVRHYCTQENQDLLNDWCLKERSRDEECWYDLVKSPYLLYMSQMVLLNTECVHKSLLGLLWCIRCLYIEQQLLLVKSNRLWLQMKSLIDKVKEKLKTDIQLSDDIKCATHLELSRYFLFYYEFELAQHHLECAHQCAGITIELSGALGRRTKFQDRDIAQLMIKITKKEEKREENKESKEKGDKEGKENGLTANDSIDLPKDIILDDDTLLTQVKYTDQAPPTQLTTLQQAVILGTCSYQRSSGPVNRLTTEELEAYINCVLVNPQSWCVHGSSLYLRSLLQKGQYRTKERSMSQLQELLDCYKKTSKESERDRQLDFHCVFYPTVWDVEKQLADILLSMGAPLSALEVYERLHMWEKVITCYQSVGRQTQAERVVRERMKVDGESVLLWCLLGDTTQDPECYKKAWELSNERSSRAQKSLGLHYLAKQMYKECVECLQRSVQINPLQEGVWFTLGHASGQIEDHSLSAKAYRHCVTLEPDNAEAWNNLAGAYLKKNEKIKAFNSFQEALKCNYENWKIWENYLTVSLDICDLNESIRSYHRLMDLRPKHLDTQVLMILTAEILQLTESDKVTTLRKKLGELLGRSVSETTGSSELWEVVSKFHLSSQEESDREKGVIELQKAQRSARQVTSWEREEQQRERVIKLTLKYSQVCRDMGKKENLISARMAVQNVAKVLKGMEPGFVPREQLELIENELYSITSIKESH